LLRAGSFRLDGGGMFGVVPKVLWQRMTAADELNRIPLNCNCLLLQRGSDLVLIETGYGDKWSDKEREIFALEHRTILDALREINVAPEDITHVIVSHLHFDHAGGLTHLNEAGEAVCSFPKARIFAQKQEWDDALVNKSTMTRTYLRNHLDPIAQQLELVDGEAQPLSGIDVWPLPGHTWGQQGIRFNDGSGIVAFIGDVMPTVNHVGLAFSIGYDMLPYQNMLTKKATLERAAAEHWRIAIDHEPGDSPVVRVEADKKEPGQYILIPAPPGAG
jgi:glyoxylase-like metal-dependent hydrolase (beta-lactamase superfamily II)